MLLIALVILLIDKHLFVWPPDLKLIRDEFLIVGASLFGIGTSPQVTTGRDLLLPVARILGFIFLGLWIGVAANRLGRLSSESVSYTHLLFPYPARCRVSTPLGVQAV